MRINRFYVDQPLRPGAIIELGEQTSRHIQQVLRLRIDQHCVVFNGDGNDYQAKLLSLRKRGVEVEIISAALIDNESRLAIRLIQGVARGEKMDFILQKATELGVQTIMPVISDRTEVKLDSERAEKRLAHWRAVIASACEQSGRARLPTIESPDSLANNIASLTDQALKVALDPEAQLSIASLSDALAKQSNPSVCVAIGPEGGFSQRDLDMLKTGGFVFIRLGPRILRTETAGLAAISALQTLYGDW